MLYLIHPIFNPSLDIFLPFVHVIGCGITQFHLSFLQKTLRLWLKLFPEPSCNSSLAPMAVVVGEGISLCTSHLVTAAASRSVPQASWHSSSELSLQVLGKENFDPMEQNCFAGTLQIHHTNPISSRAATPYCDGKAVCRTTHNTPSYFLIEINIFTVF